MTFLDAVARMHKTRLTDLVVNRVDLVDEGANQGAHIVLFKRGTVRKGGAQTVGEIMAANEAREQFYHLRSALEYSIECIFRDEELNLGGKIDKLSQSVEEFAEAARDLIPTLEKSMAKRVSAGLAALGSLADDLRKGAGSLDEDEDKPQRRRRKRGDMNDEKEKKGKKRDMKKSLGALLELAKSVGGDDVDDDETSEIQLPEGLDAAAIQETVEYVTELEKQNAELSARLAKVEKSIGSEDDEDDGEDEAVWKGVNPKLREMFESQGEKLAKAEKTIGQMTDDNRVGEIVAELRKAFVPGDHAQLAKIAYQIEKSAGAEAVETYLASLRSSAAIAKASGAIFDEIGATGDSDPLTVHKGRGGESVSKVDKLAKALIAKSEKPITIDQARVRVLDEHPELYAEHQRDHMRYES